MKKRLLTLLLVVSLTSASMSVSASAANDSDSAVQTIQALGIMQGDETGNLMLANSVTRAQFVAMMSRASSFKDSISADGTGYSLFKDVKSDHWASEYIRLAIQEGWATGYIDGTFRPDQTITLEEACTMVLRLLGYDSSSLAGSFPAAQLNKASALGLRDQVSVKQGEQMTRLDCAQLFYNLLTAQDSTGRTYATTLGYTVTNGEVDYTAVVRENLSGPYIAAGGDSLPFTPVTIYRNGTPVSSAALNRYDVYYYNEGLRTVWIYTERTAGKITALTPSSSAPTAVTVAGTSYTIGSSSVTYQLSALGGDSTGTLVTLLLGMDDKVVGVLSGTEVENTSYYGVILSVVDGVSTNGDATVETTVTVACTDGVTRSFAVEYSTAYSADTLVSVNLTNSGISLKTLSAKSLNGKVSKDGTTLGEWAFAADVKILDTTDEGGTVSIKPERLAGCTIKSSDVRYYTLNENNEIQHLILKNVTGDTWTYAYLTDMEDLSTDMSVSASYEYLLNGRTATLRTSGKKYPVDVGGVGIVFADDGSVSSMRQMSSVKLTELGVQSAIAGNKKYAMADEVQVYLRRSGAYYQTTLSAINAENYTLTGWYDTASGDAGGLIRMIVAVEK